VFAHRIVYNKGVNKRSTRGSLVVALVVLTLLIQGVASAQVERPRYFRETGHWVTGEFLEAYESVPAPELVYGYPITDAFPAVFSRNPSGLKIQYFQRARFELHPENPPELRVTLTMLGEFFYDIDGPGSDVPEPSVPYACRNIPADGFPICFAFLQFYLAHGGIAQFGYPISELVDVDGRLVQYFQRARFEWRNDMPPGERVVISDLGSKYFYTLGEEIVLIMPADGVLEELLELQANAFVERAVMPPNGLQEIYVVVQNQYLRPVPGAQVVIHVDLPSGEERIFSSPLTNSNGVSELSFIVQDEPAGLVHVLVEVRTSELSVTTSTSFRIWR
jgi:hypothetical protein